MRGWLWECGRMGASAWRAGASRCRFVLHQNAAACEHRAASNACAPPLPAQLGVVPNAHGSAVVQCGGTRVVVGVKAEFAAMDRAAPRKGRIEAAVTCSATASPLFEGRAGEEVSAELSFVLNRMLSDGLGVCSLTNVSLWNVVCCSRNGNAVCRMGSGGVHQQRRMTEAYAEHAF